jgi:hypothetical protein
MRRYFFDVTDRASVQYDYCGCEFSNPEQARQQAELIALDVGCTTDRDCDGTEVQVRDIAGQHLFTVEIRELDRIAG